MVNNSTAALVSFTHSSFGIIDSIVFVAFLSLSGVIGIFFSLRGQKTTIEYFYGNREMSAVPIGISTGVSYLSATSIVGYPSEIFSNGWSYILRTLSGSVAIGVGIIIVSTVIHPLKVKSLNEYYLKRYESTSVMHVSNALVLVCIFHYMGACMFGSVIAFSSITGGHLSIIVALLIGFAVGVFYTTIGGVKAVVWADVLQFGVMVTGVFMVLIKSIIDNPDGLATIFEMNLKYDRLEMPSLSSDLTIRHSFWGLIFGAFLGVFVLTVQPALIQRLVSLKRKRDCYVVAAMTSIVFFLFSTIPCWVGLNIFGYYASKGCDVLAAGWIEKNDILPYYIRERLSYPGFQGLFIAAMYAGSLSSLSSSLNSASSIIWNDLLRRCFREPPSELRATLISKIVVVVFGLLGMLWGYLLLSLGGFILQISMSIEGPVYGAYCALFLLSIFFRYANSKGAIVGIVISFLFTLWLGLGSLIHGKSRIEKLPTTTANCALNVTVNKLSHPTSEPLNGTSSSSEQSVSALKYLYSVSYMWLSLICMSSCVIMALLVTACTKSRNDLDPNLLFPLCRPKFCCKLRDNSRDIELSVETEIEEKQRLSHDNA